MLNQFTLNLAEEECPIYVKLLLRLCDLVASLVLILKYERSTFFMLHIRNFKQFSLSQKLFH